MSDKQKKNKPEIRFTMDENLQSVVKELMVVKKVDNQILLVKLLIYNEAERLTEVSINGKK
jgi:hypothetical protein